MDNSRREMPIHPEIDDTFNKKGIPVDNSFFYYVSKIIWI